MSDEAQNALVTAIPIVFVAGIAAHELDRQDGRARRKARGIRHKKKMRKVS